MRKAKIVVLLTALLVGSMALGAMVGGVPLKVTDFGKAFVRRMRGEPFRTRGERIAWDFRLPRVLLAALVGSALATSGACLQALFRNPMADPYILGVSAGGALGASAALTLQMGGFGFSLRLFGIHLHAYFSAVPMMAFISALGTAWLVYLLGRVGGILRTDTLLLCGVAISALLSAIMSLLIILRPGDLPAVYFFLLGGFGWATWDKVGHVLPYVLLGLLGALLYARHLNALLMGEEWAHHVGVDVEKLKNVIIATAALGCSAAVAYAGIIGFVGLIAPHIVRLLIGADHRFLLPGAALAGALLMVLCDIPARTLTSGELPVGIFTAIAGVPFFLYLLRRSKQVRW